METILKKIYGIDSDYRSDAMRHKLAKQEGWVSVVSNLFLFLLKLVAGIFSGSISLLADAFHSLSDIISSVVLIVGIKLASKPPDKRHPFGHGRAEAITTLIIAMLMIFVAIEFFESAVQRIIKPEEILLNSAVLVVITLSIIIKELNAQYAYSLGRLVKSDALVGEAAHHRSDALSSILVLIALAGERFGFRSLDGLAAFLVAGIMAWSAYKIARKATDELLGKSAEEEEFEEVTRICMQVEGVQNVHDTIIHTYGSKKFLTLHLELMRNQSADRLHSIADRVENLLREKLNAHVVTHIDPIDSDSAQVSEVETDIQSIFSTMNLDAKVQNLRIVSDDEVRDIIFDIQCDSLPKEKLDGLENRLLERYPKSEFHIHVL